MLVAGVGAGVAPPPAPVAGGVEGAVPVSEPVQIPEPEVAAAPQTEDNESEVDGCDVDFTVDVTPDEELPPTKGGVG